jgi:RNA polymerase sigma-70 factor (ECF subfamily)
LTDWAAIVREHGAMAVRTAWRILGDATDTEDAVQEAFLDAHRLHLARGVRNWGATLRHLASCRALDLLRVRRRRPRAFAAEPAAPPSSQPEAVAVERECAQMLRQALATLPTREAEVFSLRFFGDLRNDEVA